MRRITYKDILHYGDNVINPMNIFVPGDGMVTIRIMKYEHKIYLMVQFKGEVIKFCKIGREVIYESFEQQNYEEIRNKKGVIFSDDVNT